MTFLFHTLGCKVNQYDSQTLKTLFKKSGYSECQPECEPDLIVVNSCTVTAESDRKTRQTVNRFRKLYPNAVIAVTGCMLQACPEKGKQLKNADIIIGNSLNADLPRLVERFKETGIKISEHAPHQNHEPICPLCSDNFEGRTRAFVKIEDGCNRFCSYCLIPYARGRVRSKPLDVIKNEISFLADNGYTEVVLAGINLSAYGFDFNDGTNLCHAIEAVAQIEKIKRIRLGSMEPDQLTVEMLERLSRVEKLMPQFHLSLQSGSDGVLKRMKRHYDSAFYLDLCEKIHNLFDNASLTTDIMCGFPGETYEEFEETLEFVKKAGFAKIHAFAYSQREGTPASVMENQIPKGIKEERNRKLIEVGTATRKVFFDRQIGKIFNVLFERQKEDGLFEGYTENYTPVKVKSNENISGKIIPVLLTENRGEYCFGEIEKKHRIQK